LSNSPPSGSDLLFLYRRSYTTNFVALKPAGTGKTVSRGCHRIREGCLGFRRQCGEVSARDSILQKVGEAGTGSIQWASNCPALGDGHGWKLPEGGEAQTQTRNFRPKVSKHTHKMNSVRKY